MLDYSLLIAIEKNEDFFDEARVIEKRRRYTAISRNKMKGKRGGTTNRSILSRKSEIENGNNISQLISPEPKTDSKGFLTFRNPDMSSSEVVPDTVRRSTETTKPIELLKPEV